MRVYIVIVKSNTQRMTMLRKCKTCSLEATTEEDLELFVKDSSMLYDRSNTCKTCRQTERRERDITNKEHNAKRAANWYQENLEERRAYGKRYNIEHNTERKAYRKQYREDNKEELARQNVEYHQKNPEKLKARSAKYRAAKRFQTPELTANEKYKIQLLYKIALNIEKQTSVAMHVDHIVPIAKGGLHHPLNLRVITTEENLSKSDELPTLSAELIALHSDYYGTNNSWSNTK